MPVTIVTKGLIGLYRDGVLISDHTVESKGIESALRHAETHGNGDYELRYPNKAVKVSLLQKTVVPFSWDQPVVAFSQGTAGSVDLASFLLNPERRSIGYSVVGALPSGVTLAGSVLVYNGSGPVASSTVSLVASSGGLESTSSPVAVSVEASNAPPATLIAGETFETRAIGFTFVAPAKSLELGGTGVNARDDSDNTIATVSSAHTYGSGTRSLRLPVPGNGAGDYRSQLNVRNFTWENQGGFPDNLDHWCGIAYLLDASYPHPQTQSAVHWQTHTQVGQPGTSPIWGLRTSGTDWIITNEGLGETIPNFTIGPYQGDIGRWVRWVFYTRWSMNNTGIFSVYKDGVRVAHFQNTRTLAVGTTAFPYYSMGPYASFMDVISAPSLLCYLDEFRLTGPGGSVAAVDPVSYL